MLMLVCHGNICMYIGYVFTLNYRFLLQKSTIKETIYMYIGYVCTLNYRSLLQKSPMKETICMYIGYVCTLNLNVHTHSTCIVRHIDGVATIRRLLKMIGLFCRISCL